jgi:hypothetical protein
MKLNLNIAHDLKPEELRKIVDLSKKTNQPISQLILEAARELAADSQADRDNAKPQENGG